MNSCEPSAPPANPLAEPESPPVKLPNPPESHPTRNAESGLARRARWVRSSLFVDVTITPSFGQLAHLLLVAAHHPSPEL
jgi:hypothetical protein